MTSTTTEKENLFPFKLHLQTLDLYHFRLKIQQYWTVVMRILLQNCGIIFQNGH